MNEPLLIPLVGMGHHPPAKAILQCLPQGAELQLVPEPTNPYDSGAVQVHVAPSTIPVEADQELSLHLAGYGTTVEEFRAAPSWFLGFLAQKMPKAFAEAEGISLNEGVCTKLLEEQDSRDMASEQGAELDGGYRATLTFAMSGAPLVSLTFVPLMASAEIKS